VNNRPAEGFDAAGPVPARQRGALRLVAAVLAEFDGPGGDVSVLDCGGGSGSLAVPVAELGAHVTVVDVSVDALATLTRRAAEAGVARLVRAVHGDLENLGAVVADASFDVVLVHDVLDVVDHRAVLAAAATAVRPGGFISLLIANPAAGVLAKVLAGDLDSALAELQVAAAGGGSNADLNSSTLDSSTLPQLCVDVGLMVDRVEGIGVFADLIPSGFVDGVSPAGRDVADITAEMETLVAATPPYRDIAVRLHVVARRPQPPGEPAGARK